MLIETIHDWGVNVVFGIPGDGINGIMEALRTHRDEVRFVQNSVTGSMPGKISARQAAKFAESLARGTPNRGKVALTIVSERSGS